MSRFRLRSVFGRARLLGPVAVVATLAAGALPAFAQTAPGSGSSNCSMIRFELANPSPGSRVEPGGYVLQGLATDSHASQGAGIDRIDFFLDSRDQGGINIGSAVPGLTPGPFGPDSFQTTLTLPNMIGGHDLVAYAHSSVTNQESVIAVPIALGEDPSKAAETSAQGSTPTTTETCASGSSTTTTTTTTPVANTTETGNTTTIPATTTSPGASTVTLDVANPSASDTIHVGGYSVEGLAFDRAAQSGTGIDRIDIFLDSRDQGGMLLGQATFGQNNLWHAIISIPSNQTGLHTLFFYAHSTVNDMETVVSVPVTVAP